MHHRQQDVLVGALVPDGEVAAVDQHSLEGIDHCVRIAIQQRGVEPDEDVVTHHPVAAEQDVNHPPHLPVGDRHVVRPIPHRDGVQVPGHRHQ